MQVLLSIQPLTPAGKPHTRRHGLYPDSAAFLAARSMAASISPAAQHRRRPALRLDSPAMAPLLGPAPAIAALLGPNPVLRTGAPVSDYLPARPAEGEL